MEVLPLPLVQVHHTNTCKFLNFSWNERLAGCNFDKIGCSKFVSDPKYIFKLILGENITLTLCSWNVLKKSLISLLLENKLTFLRYMIGNWFIWKILETYQFFHKELLKAHPELQWKLIDDNKESWVKNKLATMFFLAFEFSSYRAFSFWQNQLLLNYHIIFFFVSPFIKCDTDQVPVTHRENVKVWKMTPYWIRNCVTRHKKYTIPSDAVQQILCTRVAMETGTWTTRVMIYQTPSGI